MKATWNAPQLVRLQSGSEAEIQKVPQQAETCTADATVPIDDPRNCFELFQDGLAELSTFEVIGAS